MRAMAMFSCHRCCYKVFKGCHVRPHIYKHLHLFAETWCARARKAHSALIRIFSQMNMSPMINTSKTTTATKEQTNEWTNKLKRMNNTLKFILLLVFSLLLLLTFNVTLFRYLTMTTTTTTLMVMTTTMVMVMCVLRILHTFNVACVLFVLLHVLNEWHHFVSLPIPRMSSFFVALKSVCK